MSTPGFSAPGSLGRIDTFEDNWIEANNEDDVVHHQRDASAIEVYSFRFTSPDADQIFRDVRDNEDPAVLRFDNRANRNFYARLYQPADRVRDVAIIYNGLDETVFQLRDEASLFGFYTRLGAYLASNGIQAILLPTPYHMNRAMAYTDAERERARREAHSPPRSGSGASDTYSDYTVPTSALMRHPYNIYRNHFQGFKETLALCSVLRRVGPAPAEPVVTERVSHLLTDKLHPTPEIALVGYSLGGLRALTEFIHERIRSHEERRGPMFSACVALSSGGALSDLPAPPWVDPTSWHGMISQLVIVRGDSERFMGLGPKDKDEATRHFAILEDVFLGRARSLIELEKIDRRAPEEMFFVVGGSDELVPLDSLQRFAPSGGINVLQIARMGHMYRYRALQKWERPVLQLIAEFIRSSCEARLERSFPEELAELVALLDYTMGVIQYDEDILAHDIYDRATQRIREAIGGDASIVGRTLGPEHSPITPEQFCAYAGNVLRRFEHLVTTDRCHPGIYKNTRRQLLFGWHVTKDPGLIDQWANLVAKEGKRLGEILVEMKVISPNRRDQAVQTQEAQLRRVQEVMARDLKAWMEAEKP